MPLESVGSPLLWTGFIVFILAMLALDLGVFHRRAHEVRFKEAAGWTLVWVALAVAFNLGVYLVFGSVPAMEFLTGYLIEYSLSADNLFVFLVIFSTFAVPAAYQHRVLFWGVVGAVVMRAIFIVAGVAALQAFHWVMYVFGALLLATGVKLLFQHSREEHPERNPLFRAFQRIVPATGEYHGQRLFVRVNGRTLATPLFVVLMLVEITDLVFAVDSVPAIFAVTRDPFIVFTSNMFAILGLRSLYFCLAGFANRLRYLRLGLAGVLIFVALKMLVSEFYEIPIVASLLVVAALLAAAVVASLLARPAASGHTAVRPQVALDAESSR